MKRPATKIKLKRPVLETGPSGNKYCRGSLSETNGVLIDPRQEKEILDQIGQGKPLGSLVITGMNAFNPFHSEAVRRYVSRAAEHGYAEVAKNANGASIGWRLTPAGEEFRAGLNE